MKYKISKPRYSITAYGGPSHGPPGLGDELITLRVVCALNKLGMDVQYSPYRKNLASLMSRNTPICYNPCSVSLPYTNIESPAVDQIKNRFNTTFGTSINKLNVEAVPTNHIQLNVGYHDVAITSHGNNLASWDKAQYRNWPNFDQLKQELTINNISWVDVSDTRDHKFLSLIANAKTYVSIDTGQSHLASRVGAHKTLIIQSGVNPFQFWATGYNFDYISKDTNCKWCQNTKGSCQFNHQCMDIDIADVINWIQLRL